MCLCVCRARALVVLSAAVSEVAVYGTSRASGVMLASEDRVVVHAWT